MSSASSASRSDGRARVVAVVDDDVDVAPLERAGFTVQRVRVAEVRTVAHGPPVACWVIGHGGRSAADGLSLVARVREADDRVPVVMITDEDDARVLLAAMRLGVRDAVRRSAELGEVLATRLRATVPVETPPRSAPTAATLDAAQRLEEIDRRKDAFLAMLGHELRNPLAPISNAVEVLRLHGTESSEVRWAVGVVHRQVGQLRRLVDDLLDVAGLTYGEQHLPFTPLLLGDLVARAVARCRERFEERGHRVTERTAQEPLRIHGNAARLEQAVVNLLDNAAKYTPDGGDVTVTVARDGDEAVVRVLDTGVGILSADLAAIFQLFVQGDAGAPRSTAGLGVGLSLVSRIAELHGGRIEARSGGSGRGSEFTLRLPLGRATASEAAAPPRARPDCHALVVDGDPDCAEAMSTLLRLWGFHVRTAHDVDAALAAIAAHEPDAVVFDLALTSAPADGARLATALAQLVDDRGRTRLALAITTTVTQEHVDRARAAGFATLAKPVDAMMLRDALAPLLAR